MFRIALYVLLTGSVILNLVLAYGLVNSGVTSTHFGDRIDQRNKQMQAMQVLFPLLADRTSKSDLQTAAKSSGLEIIEKGPNEVWISHIEFRVVDGRIEAIDFH